MTSPKLTTGLTDLELCIGIRLPLLFSQLVESPHPSQYVGVLISLWLFLFPIFLFAAQPKEFFLDGLKKLEQ
jgi:hypothetical protein